MNEVSFFDYLKDFCGLNDELIKKITESCDTIDDFFDQNTKWKSNYDLNDRDQFAKCLDFISIYKTAFIDCNNYLFLNKTFNDDEETFENCYNYFLKNTKESKTLKKEFYKLIYFKCNFKYGDFVLVNANQIYNQRLAIYVGNANSVVFYEFKRYFKEEVVRNLLLNSQTSLNYFSLDEQKFEWKKCNFNIFKIKQDYKLDCNKFIEILRHNFQVIDSLEDGDVVSMEGYKIFDSFVLYHHTALITGNFKNCFKKFFIILKFFSLIDINKFEITHKSGEPNLSNIKSVFIKKSIVKKDNLMDVIKCRKIKKFNFYDEKGKRPIKEIIETASSRLGDTQYNILADNCQHFCFQCRNNIEESPEVLLK